MYSSHKRPAVSEEDIYNNDANADDHSSEQTDKHYMSAPYRVGSITTQAVYQLSEMFEDALDSVINEYMKVGIIDSPDVAVETFKQAFQLALLSFQSRPEQSNKIGFQASNRDNKADKSNK